VGLVTLDGGEVTILTSTPGTSWPHSFSPDGASIAFAGGRDGYWNVYTVQVASRAETRLTDFSKLNAYVRYPAWSPRGDRIVFEYAETTGNVWMVESGK
jgi:Tol biopolymer transport system component